MSDVAYIMETQDPRELWLVEGENKFRVSRDMYWLLASKGADLPTTYNITELLTENAKLRELVRDLWPFAKTGWVHACPNRECCLFEKCDADSEYECPIEEYMDGRMRELGVEVDG